MSDIKIIWNEGKGDVLSRFARALSNGTGWDIVRAPDKKAALNYFMLYIQVAQSPEGVTGLAKKAALFSHYEEEVPKKAEWWNIAAPLVDIRTTWAQQYLAMLEPFGESYLVSPPIDPQFKARKKPVIGVSGYVHPGGRKGETLLKRLIADYGHLYEVVASGVGWPVPATAIRERKWEEMPAFYDSLDVYLVTSLTEGIPMPPLEALAMGKRVVAPYNVGLLDELSHPLIFRYPAGDFNGMMLAIEKASGTLVKHLDRFSEDAWCESHRIAFGLNAGAEITTSRGGLVKSEPYLIQASSESPELFIPIEHVKSAEERYSALNGQPLKELFGVPVTEVSKLPYIPHSGAVIVAYGAPARACAETALKSWKAFMPDYPIALVSDTPLGIEDKFIFNPDTDIGARSVKTNLYELAPTKWKNVLYLDADTEIVADVSVIFQWLADGFEFLICTNPSLYASIEKGKRPDNVEELEVTKTEVGTGDFLQMNGGVFAFRRGKRAKALMEAWHSEWQRFGGRDQMALIRALHKNPLRWRLLGNEWNTILRFCEPEITAGILHYALRARRWEGIIHGRLDSEAAWKKVKEKP